MVVHAVLKQPQLLTVDGSGATVADSDQNLMRWCNYPGERLLKKVRFEVNGNPLDEYTRDAVNFHREFQVQPNKQTGWNRNMGQELAENGYLDQPNWASSGVASADVDHRMKAASCSGNQTPTGQKDTTAAGDIELFIPLLFWCNRDPRLAVPSVAIPYGQRFITMDLCSANELVGEVPRGANAGSWTQASADAGGKFSVDNDPTLLKSIELYINNIFVNPEVHNIFIKRIGFTLIRVHRQQDYIDNQGGDTSLLLQNLKWPIEALFVGMRVQDYTKTTGTEVRQHLDKWHAFSTVTKTSRANQGWKSRKATLYSGTTVVSAIPALAGETLTVSAVTLTTLDITASTDVSAYFSQGAQLSFTNATGSAVWTVQSVSADGLTVSFDQIADENVAFNADELVTTDPTTAFELVGCESVEQTATVDVCSPNLSAMTVKAHGIPIYNNFPAGFYNSYLPYNYGGHNIRTPEDCGALMVTFGLYPGTYQPSGHINVSRAREFYLDYTTTSNIDSSNSGSLVIVASAINFLLISDGSAVLRYST